MNGRDGWGRSRRRLDACALGPQHPESRAARRKRAFFFEARIMTHIAVAIQGEAGSFSHAAAREALCPDVRLVPCTTFDELFRAVEAGEATRGVVPIENSLAGSVYEAYDALGGHALHVVGETQVRVRHCLVVRPGTALPAIRRVASHPVALAQCRRFFVDHPAITSVPAYDPPGTRRA